MQDATSLPDDLKTCHALLHEQTSLITELKARLTELSKLNDDYKRTKWMSSI
ncbi:MAG: hypothetical protein R3C53_19280 [Pirellulaceae bacterium]